MNLENYIHSVHKTGEQLLQNDRKIGVVEIERYMLHKSIRSTESKSYLSVERNSFFNNHIFYVSGTDLIDVPYLFMKFFTFFHFYLANRNHYVLKYASKDQLSIGGINRLVQ